MPSKTSILVTSVGGRAVGYQILECLQPLRKKYRITVTDMDPFSPGLYEADAAYLVPSAKDKTYITKLIQIAKKENVKIVLIGHEAEVKAIAKNKERFIKEGIIPIVNDYSIVEKIFNKIKLAEFLAEKNILTPKTVLLDNYKNAETLKFPIVVKPIKDSSGSRNCFIIKDLKELQVLFKDLQKDGEVEMLAQEYVGSEDEEYTVGIVISPDKKIIDSIVMKRKLIGLTRGIERQLNKRKYVLSTGYSQGFFVDQPDVKTYCEHVAKTIGVVGPLNIQCRRGKEGVYIFEIHPRFSGSASQRAEMGFNEPDTIIRSFLFGEKIDGIKHKLNYIVMRKFANTVITLDKYKKMQNNK